MNRTNRLGVSMTINQALSEALTRVCNRLDSKNETLAAAVEAIAPDYDYPDFSAMLTLYAQGKYSSDIEPED